MEAVSVNAIDLSLNEVDHDIVTQQLTLVHDALCLQPQLAAFPNLLPQSVPRRKVEEVAPAIDYFRAYRALPSARLADNQKRREKPFASKTTPAHKGTGARSKHYLSTPVKQVAKARSSQSLRIQLNETRVKHFTLKRISL